MKNFKISKKVTIVFVTVVLMAAVPTVLGLVSAGNMSRQAMENNRVIIEPLNYFVNFYAAIGNVRVAMRDIATTTDADASQRQADLINANLDIAAENLREYYNLMEERRIAHPKRYELVRDIYHTIVNYATAVRTYIIPFGLANENQQVLYNIPAFLSQHDNFVSDLAVQLTAMKAYEGQASAELMARTNIENRIFGISMGVIVAILIIFAARYLIKTVAKPIERISVRMSEMARGNLNVNIDKNLINNKDEVGVLTANLCSFADVVNNIVGDIEKFSHEMSVKGDIEYRIDASKYQGDYNQMITGLNVFTDNLTGDIVRLIGVLKAISQGDFSAKLEKLPGKKVVLNEAVDSVTENLNSVFAEVSEMLKLMVEAKTAEEALNFSINETKYEGDWRKIMEGLNRVTQSVYAPLGEIAAVMARLGEEGYIDKRIEGAYFGVFLTIKNAVNRTMSELSDVIHDVSKVLSAVSSGDLTAQVTKDYHGDFAAIKESINTISFTLNKTMSEISAASEQVSSGVKQISSSAAVLANGATEQASSVQELDASIDMITEQTKQNANSADEATTLSNKSTENAQKGSDAIKQMVEAMAQIKESSNNISHINKVIQDIAFQTNLLALNAAVEAARAGEHGKGFAVVAEEVRNLAARSQTAAKETTGLIEDSIKRVDLGSDIAQSTAEALTVIVANANDVLEIINSISASSREQADAVGQVRDGIGQISSVVQSNSAVSEETAAAAEELNSQAELLRQLVAFFKL